MMGPVIFTYIVIGLFTLLPMMAMAEEKKLGKAEAVFVAMAWPLVMIMLFVWGLGRLYKIMRKLTRE